jgi:transcriptional regulator with XRE-family HTH domain
MSIFSENLKAGRERAGLSRQDMADTLGISVSAYGNYETGYRAPKLEMLPVIAEKLSTNIDKLLGYNTPSEERDLFAECKKLIESVTIGGEPLLVSKTRHLGEKEYSGVVIQRGGELGYPFARFSSRAEFIAFVQGIMRDFKESRTYLDDLQLFFVRQLLKTQAQQAYDEARSISVDSRDLLNLLQKANPKTPKQIADFEGLKEMWTNDLRRSESLMQRIFPVIAALSIDDEPPEDKATNRPPASQGVAESGHPGDEVAKSHPVEDETPKQGVTESPTPEAAPPEQEAPKPRRKRQKNSAPSKNETPSK